MPLCLLSRSLHTTEYLQPHDRTLSSPWRSTAILLRAVLLIPWKVAVKILHSCIRKVHIWFRCYKRLKNHENLGKLERNNESRSNTEITLCYLIAVLNTTITLVCASLHTGHLSPPVNKRCSFAYLHNCYYCEQTQLNFSVNELTCLQLIFHHTYFTVRHISCCSL
jgi:hypothetical protein